MRRALYPVMGLLIATSFLLGMLASGGRGGRLDMVATRHDPAQPPVVVSAVPVSATPAAGAVDFAAIAERINAVIVNVDTTVASVASESPRRWSRDTEDRVPREGSGSGFVIDAAGYILTNHHVVEGADRVTVTLPDGRALRATVVGTDPAIDVALLRVKSATPLEAATLGRSGVLRVGEWVCAVGNPLGYVHSVTVGVVSFLGRKLFDQSLDEFIQTDAAISFGNSGGPLINARGEVVGITTAVSTQASNIGFAVPIDQVMAVLPQLRDTGRVSRGYIGVVLTSVTRPLAQALRLPTSTGALVEDIPAGTPAERAGLRPYDVIVAVDDSPVRTDDELIRAVAARTPGALVTVSLLRDGAPRQVSVKLTERPLTPPTRPTRMKTDLRAVADPRGGRLGIVVQTLDSPNTRRLGIPASIAGVVINEVDATGPGRDAHLRRGEVILEVNRRPVLTAGAFAAATAALASGEPVALLVYDPVADQRLIVTIVVEDIR